MIYIIIYSRIASNPKHRSIYLCIPSAPLLGGACASLCRTFYFMFSFLFSFPWIPNCTRKVIGGELQERLIPVPYSKTSTDQAVRFTFMRGPPVSLTLYYLFNYFYVNIFSFFICSKCFNTVLCLSTYNLSVLICSPLACVS